MALVDMKRPKAEIEKMEVPQEVEQDKYPYGLRITLEDAELGKLGISVKELDVGNEMSVKAIAKITNLEDRDSSGRGHRQSASLQIIKLDIPKPNGKTARHFANLNRGPG